MTYSSRQKLWGTAHTVASNALHLVQLVGRISARQQFGEHVEENKGGDYKYKCLSLCVCLMCCNLMVYKLRPEAGSWRRLCTTSSFKRGFAYCGNRCTWERNGERRRLPP